MSFYARPDEDMDPANFDCCDEHETVFRKGEPCPKCEAEPEEGVCWQCEGKGCPDCQPPYQPLR